MHPRDPAAPAEAPDGPPGGGSSPPARLGRYALSRLLGRGGMGEVWLATAEGAEGFRRRVVVKRILPHLAADETFARRFVREGRLAAHLHHPGIAQVLDLGRSDDAERTLYLAMEHVDGRDLRALLRTARELADEGDATFVPEPALAVALLRQVLAALDHAHAATDEAGAPLGLVHRDVGPANVMLSRTGDAKLVDFGLARAAERLGRSETGGLQGTFGYMSPEQAAGKTLDRRSDLFSVGVLAWELLTGARPFDADTDLGTLDRVRHHDPGPLAVANPDVPDEVAAVVDQLLAKDPEARPSSAGEAERALTAWAFASGEAVDRSELAEWVGALCELADERAVAPSLDTALAAGLAVGAARPPRDTVTRTVAAAPVPRISDPCPASSAPSASGPETASGQTPAVAATRGASEPVSPRRRRARPLVAALVVANLALLAAVAWLVLDRPAPQQAPPDLSPEPLAATASAASEAAPAPEPSPRRGPGAIATLAQAPALSSARTSQPARTPPSPPRDALVTPAAEDAAPRASAAPASGPSRSAASAAGAPVAPRGPGPREPDTKPQAPRALGAEERGVPVRAVEGEASEVARAPARRPPIKPSAEDGGVVFRFFPANATVLIDGKPVTARGGSNLVDAPLEPGRHTVELVGHGGQRERRTFRVSAGQRTNLRTLVLGGPAGPRMDASDGP